MCAQAALVREDSLEASRGPRRRQPKSGASAVASAPAAAEPPQQQQQQQQQQHTGMDVRDIMTALQTEGSSFVRAHLTLLTAMVLLPCGLRSRKRGSRSARTVHTASEQLI